MVYVCTPQYFMARLNRDDRHLAKLREYYARHGVLPSYSGISRVVGFQAKNAAVKLVSRLSRAGYLRLSPDGRLAPNEKFFEHSLASSARAGAPDIIDGTDLESINIDRYLIDKPTKTVLVRVKGDSMKNVGIYDGDIVVVERREEAYRGEFVVSRIDGEYTLKELDFEGRKPVLRPHNEEFDVMRPAHLEIVGVVIGVVRRYIRRNRENKR